MWTKFTEQARRAIFKAQEAADRCETNVVGIEHLLVGVLDEDDTIAARLLADLGYSIGEVRQGVESILRRGAGRAPGETMNLGASAKRAIDHAYNEARRQGYPGIGVEHLLLGVIAVRLEPTSRLFTALDIELDACRDALTVIKGQGATDEITNRSIGDSTHLTPSSEINARHGLTWQAFTENGRDALLQAQREAARLGGNVVWPEHLLMGILRAEAAVSHRLLAALDLTAREVIGELEPVISRGPAHDAEREMQLHPTTRTILNEAREEAIRGRSNFIGTEHLLIAVIATAREPSAGPFRTRGIDAGRARAALDNLYPPERATPTPREAEMLGRLARPAPPVEGGPVRMRTRPAEDRRAASRRLGILVLVILLALVAALIRLIL